MLTEREVSPQLGLLKSTLLQLDSTFSERSYGAGSFRDFVEKLEEIGVLRVQQGKGGWLVAPPDGAARARRPAERTTRLASRRGADRRGPRAAGDAPSSGRPFGAAPPVTGIAGGRRAGVQTRALPRPRFAAGRCISAT